MESKTVGKAAWFVAAASFALCVAPIFISYKPYEFSWDDSDYLLRAITVNRAFWSGDVHGLGAAMVSWHTPAMTFLGLPWGPLASRNAAGDCFVTLAAVTALLAAVSLYLLLRIGVKPLFLVIASVCVGASLGPYQAGVHANHMHDLATRFLSDNLFAWATLAAVLLIPFEARTPCPSIRGAVLRGILCASIFSLGALTKVSFFYFVGLIVPLLLFIRFYYDGIRSTLAWLVAFVCATAPVAIYFLRYGRAAFAEGKAASFGGLADFYRVPLHRFLADTILESPGLMLSLVLLAAASVYLVVEKRPSLLQADFIASLITIGYGIIVLASSNREIRFAFPVIVGLPFLVALLLSYKEDSISSPLAGLIAGLVFLGLAAAVVPMRNRPYQQSLASAQAVLTQAARCNAKDILLATDSPSLNVFLLNLASELSSSEASIRTLAYHAMSGVPIQDDFAAMSKSDMVVFQDAPRLRPKFTNQRVPEYERYIQQLGSVPARVAEDTIVYPARCNP